MQRLIYQKPNKFFNIFYAFPILYIFAIVTIGLVTSNILASHSTSKEEIEQTRLIILFSSIIFSIFVLIINFFLSRRLTKPIGEILDLAESLRQGDYTKRMINLPKNELGYLGETLNHLGGQISQQIAKISHEKTQLKTMLTGMVEGIISLDQNMKIVFCNRSAYQILGIEQKDIRGLTINRAINLHELNELAEKAKSKQELIEEEIVIRRDLKKITLEAYATYFSSEGMSGIIIVLYDVTQMLHLESVRRDFVANVSHEIKTPLTAIKGYAETLLDGALEDQETSRKFVDKIYTNAQRLNSLVVDLISLAQIEASDESFVRVSPTDWIPIIKSSLSANEDEFKKFGIQVSTVGLETSCMVLGEKEAMLQIFNNLITNAIRYSPREGILKISLIKTNEEVNLEVTDTGIGIPEKDLERIFERFYRVDKARSRSLGGTGLGLSIVKHLVKKLQGEIHVESELGKGSTFRIKLKAV